MDFQRCHGIILKGWAKNGQRTGLLPPRRCRRPALPGYRFCDVHQPQEELHELLNTCFGFGWEVRVEGFFRQKERDFEPKARNLVARLANLSYRAGLGGAYTYLSSHRTEVAQLFSQAHAEQPATWKSPRKIATVTRGFGAMDFRQCGGIVVKGWTQNGRRTGLVPPHRCRRPALQGAKYCEVHQPQSDLQDLLGACFVYGWEHRVDEFIRQKEREYEKEALRLVDQLGNLAQRANLGGAHAYLSTHPSEVVRLFTEVHARQPESWRRPRMTGAELKNVHLFDKLPRP